jgi:hypothetical protein
MVRLCTGEPGTTHNQEVSSYKKNFEISMNLFKPQDLNA